MDGAIVIAALILNPIARRKRAAQASEPVEIVGAPINSTGGSNSPEESDFESGDRSTVGKNIAGGCGSR
jgi:hypothetical protein